jgi:hypothetical protein
MAGIVTRGTGIGARRCRPPSSPQHHRHGQASVAPQPRARRRGRMMQPRWMTSPAPRIHGHDARPKYVTACHLFRLPARTGATKSSNAMLLDSPPAPRIHGRDDRANSHDDSLLSPAPRIHGRDTRASRASRWSRPPGGADVFEPVTLLAAGSSLSATPSARHCREARTSNGLDD